MTVSSSTNKVSYNGDGSTTVFAYSFKVFDQDDLTVILRASDGTETTQTLTTNYSVSGVGDAGGGNVTMVTAPASGQILTIVREQPLTQGLDLVPNDPFPAQSLEESLDKLTFIDQRLSENIDRALSFSVGDIVDSATLPVKEDRIGRVLGFNATTGNPEAGPEIADVSTLSAITADISTLADIEDGTDATDAIQTVAGISGNVTTVAGISSDVTTVAGITGNIASVVADEADIGVVAGISGDVSTVSAISTDVTTVAADGTDIGVVAGISSDVTTVSGISTDVTTVSSISSDVTTVVGNAASITTVAGNSSNVTIVADNIADVTTVASNIGSITTKVSKSGDTMTGNLLFDDTSKVLLGTRSNLQIYHSATAIVASNITLYFTNGSTSGTMVITDTDHTISVSDTVRVDSPEILNSTPVTVAGVVISSLQQDLTVSATTATTFTVPVTYASDPGTTGTLGQAGTYYYYTGSATSYISEQGAGSLHVLGSEINVYNADETSQLAQFSTAATKLFHNNSEKLTTTATGISLPEDLTVQGNLTVQGTTITVDSATAQTIDLGDNDKMQFGDGNDLQIYHTGTTNYVYALADININANTGVNIQAKNGEESIVAEADGAVTLYYDNASKLATTATGVDITGTLTSDGLTVDGDGTVNITSSSVDTLQLTRTDVGGGTRILMENGNDNIWRLQNDGANVFSLAYNTTTAFDISSNGDISFYEDTGTTPKFFWDASAESLGIGTTSPAALVDISKSGTGDYSTLKLSNTGASGRKYELGVGGSGTGDYAGKFYVYDSTAGQPRFSLDSSGNVGIGTSSPLVPLHVSTSGTSTASGGNAAVTIRSEASGRSSTLQFSDGTVSTWIGQVSGSNINFGTTNTERMRIDSSGNLLVGKTSTAIGTAGATLWSDGLTDHTRSGEVLRINRLSTDGNIVTFRKDGTTVGSIGSRSGIVLTVGSSSYSGLDFGSPSISPMNANTRADNAIDLGSSSHRFKDLYLSGGVYLGGTGSANKLDDYEEGTWTPVFTGWTTTGTTSVDGSYTKIGNTVIVTGRFRSTTGSIASTKGTSTITGLPFSISGFTAFSVSVGQGGSGGGGVGANNGDTLYAPTISAAFEDIYFQATYHTT